MDSSSSISPPVLVVDIVTSRVQDGVSTMAALYPATASVTSGGICDGLAGAYILAIGGRRHHQWRHVF